MIKVVGYYDFSVLSVSVMVSKKKFGWVVGVWVELYQIELSTLHSTFIHAYINYVIHLSSLSFFHHAFKDGFDEEATSLSMCPNHMSLHLRTSSIIGATGIRLDHNIGH